MAGAVHNSNLEEAGGTSPPSSWRTTVRSLRFKASLLIVLLLVFVTSISSTLTARVTNQVFYENEYARTREWAQSLAIGTAEAVLAGDRESLGRTVADLIKTNAVAYVAFCNAGGEVLVSGETKSGLLRSILSPDGQTLNLKAMNVPELVWNDSVGLACSEVTVPVFSKATIRPSGASTRSIVGYLHLAVDVTATKRQLGQVGARIRQIALALVLLAIPCSIFVTRRVVSPLKELAQTACAIAKGSTDARAHIQSEDEIGDLARSFNTMADRLTQSRMELLELNAELEERVEQRTRELQELAARDPLTGLYNRRHFGEVMAREFAAAERYDADLTCLMLDLDRFKETNDLFGHRTGDEVLAIMAQVIATELRGSDVAARFGGDEYIVLLPQTSAASAAVLTDRINERFGEEVKRRFPDVPVGVSIGVASLRITRAPSAEALIHEADVALYAAKELRRSTSSPDGRRPRAIRPRG
jgi:diguanylate cyclase (GGDEF)-like protein